MTGPAWKAERFDHQAHLEDALKVAWMALEGDRLLVGKGEDAQAFQEPAPPLLREIRALTKELAALKRVNPTEQESTVDELARRRAESGRGTAGTHSAADAPKRRQPRRSSGRNRTS